MLVGQNIDKFSYLDYLEKNLVNGLLSKFEVEKFEVENFNDLPTTRQMFYPAIVFLYTEYCLYIPN